MTFSSLYFNSFLKILFKSCFRFITKVHNCFIATLSMYLYSISLKIHILHINSHTLWYTNTGSEQESDNRQIPHRSFFMIPVLSSSQTFSRLNIIKQVCYLLRLQPYYSFIVKLRSIYKYTRIVLNSFFFVIILIKGSKCHELTLNTFFFIAMPFTVFYIVPDIRYVFLYVYCF